MLSHGRGTASLSRFGCVGSTHEAQNMVNHKTVPPKVLYRILRKILVSCTTTSCRSSWQLDPGPQPSTINAELPTFVQGSLLGTVHQLCLDMDAFPLWVPPTRTAPHPGKWIALLLSPPIWLALL